MMSLSNFGGKKVHTARVLPPRIVLVTTSLDFMGLTTYSALSTDNKELLHKFVVGIVGGRN